ncbi:MAG: pyridoxamine 5'-phosphate oxidase family protein [Candidatus Adiutrix sp.]
MFNDVFKEVLSHNGVVSITTWADNTVHVSNTWNSYLQIRDENKILIPAAWFRKTERNIDQNDQVILTLGSPDVQGKIGMGTGFVVKGTAKFISSGEIFDQMKEKFPFLTRVLEITAVTVSQTI